MIHHAPKCEEIATLRFVEGFDAANERLQQYRNSNEIDFIVYSALLIEIDYLIRLRS